LGKYFVFNGQCKVGDRYDGMTAAFGAGREIYIPDQAGLRHDPLTTTTFDGLLLSASLRHQASTTPLAPGFISNQYVENKFSFPIWRWAFRRHGFWKTIFCAFFSLTPLFWVTVARLICHQNIWVETAHLVAFTLIAIYCGLLLDIQREICHIKIKREQVSPAHQSLWDAMFASAWAGPPSDAYQAIEELQRGQTRKHVLGDLQYLVLPVISLVPTVDYGTFEWWMFLSNARGPLLSMSYVFSGDRHHIWAVVFGIAAFVQASMQDHIARSFITNTQTFYVNWFRRMPDLVYNEELLPWRRTLG
jgi:hypothetical protein